MMIDEISNELVKAFKAKGFKTEIFKVEFELDKAVSDPTAFIEFLNYEPTEFYDNGEPSVYTVYFPCTLKVPYTGSYAKSLIKTIDIIEEVRRDFLIDELDTVRTENLIFNSVYGVPDKGSSNLICLIDAAIRYSFL